MDQLHARYPFLADARAAVESADIDLLDVVKADESPVVERAIERVDGAIHDGRVPDPILDTRVELLSYPVARVLVSLVDDPALTDRYALAEARRGFALFAADREADSGLRSSRGSRLTRDTLLSDFGLDEAVTVNGDGSDIAVTAFLTLASDLRGGRWRLVNRALADGQVPVSQVELDDLLREAIRKRVGEDLPLDVPDIIAEGLRDEVAAIETTLADVPLPSAIDRIVPEAFPPCMAALVEALQEDSELPAFERFAAVSFLCSIGMTEAEVIAFVDPATEDARESIRYTIEHIHGQTSSTAYPPPGCTTMEAAGACVDDVDRCIDIGHPLAAYANRVTEYPATADWNVSESA